MNNVKNPSRTTCEFMAASIVRVLLICTTSVTIKQIAAQDSFPPASIAQISLQFETEPSDTIAVQRKPTKLTCSVLSNSDDGLLIYWTQNDKIVPRSSRRYVDEYGSLIIKKVINKKNGSADAGVYRCIANITSDTSTAVLVSRPAHLKIAEITSPSGQRENFTSTVGGAVRLSCGIKSTPEATITWTFNNSSLNILDERYDTTMPGVLYISPLRSSDSGEYRCHGTNSLLNKSRTSRPYSLVVNSANSFDEMFLSPLLPNRTVVREHDDLLLECDATEYPETSVVWMYSAFNNDRGSMVSIPRKRYNILKKSNVKANDSGIYTCVISHRTWSTNKSYPVHVTVATPPQIIFQPESKNLVLAQTTRLNCTASGYPQPSISWLHNGRPLRMDAHVRFSDNQLILSGLNTNDPGIYQCVASNEYGETSTAAQLFINPNTILPPVPLNLQCTPQSSSEIFLSWEQPPNNYAQPPIPILDHENKSPVPRSYNGLYAVSYHLTDIENEDRKVATTNSLFINNLLANRSYTFSVRAFNGMSGSDPSKNVSCTTFAEKSKFDTTSTMKSISSTSAECDPEQVLKCRNETILQFRLINETTVEVNWNMEKPAVIQYDTFLIKYGKQDEPERETLNVNFDKKKTIIYGLEPDTSYEISLRLITNKTEALVATESIRTSYVEKMGTVFRNSPIEVSAKTVSSSSINVTWTNASNMKAFRLIVLYSKSKTNSWFEAAVQENKNYVVIGDLLPNTVYNINVKVRDAEGEKPIASLSARTLYNTSFFVQNVTWQQLTVSSVRIHWKGASGFNVSGNSYIVSYASLPDGSSQWGNMEVPADRNMFDIVNLKPGSKYMVTIRAKVASDTKIESKTLFFVLDPNFQINSLNFGNYAEADGINLNNEQILGILIGSAIGGVFIILCIITICCCKKRFEKYQHRVSSRPRIFSRHDKHEAKMRPKNMAGFKGPYSNDRNRNLNIQLPLLSSNNGSFSNGCIQNKDIGGHKFYDVEMKTIREENDILLNSNSPLQETGITVPENNEPDHEGGDSGYCDRNHSQSPHIKDCDSVQRFRKCSDVTMDDGFYENELQGAIGVSPTKSNRLT